MRNRIRTSDLTAGERVLIDRRRRGLTQSEAAQKAGVSMHEWLNVEADGRMDGGPAVGVLGENEQCYIMRRRAGVKASEVAKKIGVSRYWLSRMERGTAPVDTLAKFWNLE